MTGEAFFSASGCCRKGIMRSADRLCWKAKILFFLPQRRRGEKTTRHLKVSFKSLGPFCRHAPQLFLLRCYVGVARSGGGGLPETVAVRRLPQFSGLGLGLGLWSCDRNRLNRFRAQEKKNSWLFRTPSSSIDLCGLYYFSTISIFIFLEKGGWRDPASGGGVQESRGLGT